MAEMCPKCGLPKELCACQEIAKEGQKIKILVDRRRFGRMTTVIEGFDKTTDLKTMSKKFKQKLACGGTSKEGRIELQGDHREKVKKMLLEMNYSEDQIDVC